jgi:hypothetical protein
MRRLEVAVAAFAPSGRLGLDGVAADGAGAPTNVAAPTPTMHVRAGTEIQIAIRFILVAPKISAVELDGG